MVLNCQLCLSNNLHKMSSSKEEKKNLPAQLELPKHMIPLTSPEGMRLFFESQAYANSYFHLSQNFETQVNGTYCGVASSVMALNSLNSTRTFRPPHTGIQNFLLYDQLNFFNEATRAVHPAEAVKSRGMQFTELVELLKCQQGVSIEAHLGTSISGSEQVRKLVREALKQTDVRVLIYYDRNKIDQEGGPHISPIGSYNEQEDLFLLMDVSRYKYETGWLSTENLFKSINYSDPIMGYNGGIILIKGDESAKYTPPRKAKLFNVMKFMLTLLVVIFVLGVIVGAVIGKKVL